MTSQTTNFGNLNPFNKQNTLLARRKMFSQPKIFPQSVMSNNNKNLRQSYIEQSASLKFKSQKPIYANFKHIQYLQQNNYPSKNMHYNQYESANNFLANDFILGNHMNKPMNSFQRYMLSSRCTPFQSSQSRINQQLAHSYSQSRSTNGYNKYGQYNGLNSISNSLAYTNTNNHINNENSLISLKLQNPFHKKHLLLKDNYMTNNLIVNNKNPTLDYQSSKYQSYNGYYNNQLFSNLQEPYVFSHYLPINVPVFSKDNSRKSQTIMKPQIDVTTIKNIPKDDTLNNNQAIDMKIIPQIIKQLIKNGGKDKIKVKGKQFYKVPLYKQI